MSLKGSARLIQAEKSRTLLYISQRVAADSAFPFLPGEPLTVTIDADNERLVVERPLTRRELVTESAEAPKRRRSRTSRI